MKKKNPNINPDTGKEYILNKKQRKALSNGVSIGEIKKTMTKKQMEKLSERLREGGKGKITPEHRAKLNKAIKGVKRSEETKEGMRGIPKYSNKNYCKPKSEEHRKNIAKAARSKEKRAKISEAMMGHPVSEESRKKISEGQKKRWEKWRQENGRK